MAEIVERHMEPMTEEIEEMRRLKLFSIAETKAILKKRKHFECKINGVMKNIQDYKDYIQYEKTLLKDIKLRRNKLRIAERKSGIEVKILKRIKNLYEIASQRFSHDFNFSLAYFKFCKESNFNQAASLVVQNMIKNFAHIADVWQVAAAWHMKRDIKQALSVIHKGLTIHPSCQYLYIEAIQLELLTREKDDWPNNVEIQNRDEICYKKIETYVDTIFQNVDSYSCLINVINMLEPYSFTKNIQHKIIEHMMYKYRNEPEVWQTLAEREKEGQHYPVPEELRTSTKFRLTKCLEKFEMGLSSVSSEKKPTMWMLYLDFLIDRYQQKDVSNNMIKNTLIQKLEQANKESVLTERYYIIWAKLLSDENRVLEIVERGLKALPKSVELWKLKLKCMVMKDDTNALNMAFKQGHLALRENSAPLWQLLIRYHILSSPNEIIEAVYRDAVRQVEQIANLIKPDYIEWIALNKDIQKAREIYKTLSITPPYCKELHAKMAKLEMTEQDISIKELERPLKLACEQFGNKDADVWINLRDCYLQHHQLFEDTYPTFDINNKIQQIRREAEQALKDNVIMLADFINRYDMPINFDARGK
ncbi:U3 small nucleolar RNA-associated protein 6 homolog [Diorhabda sublineata]|uniref:U3 small nucleolar RNA-associated protein 6 homolog n=1 Tax=Diorhabda sublineata TaxID=1163346 RepID=UPI0024E068DF|nr:U3 small nucleolar RNA-associated protein 6 homolog [Diorhabda sublineata]